MTGEPAVPPVPAEPRSAEQAAFERWCPIKITDESKAPKSAALVKAYWTAWQACSATLRSQLATAEHWKDDWFTKLSAIEKRAETAERENAEEIERNEKLGAALLSAQKEIERLKRELSWANKPTT